VEVNISPSKKGQADSQEGCQPKHPTSSPAPGLSQTEGWLPYWSPSPPQAPQWQAWGSPCRRVGPQMNQSHLWPQALIEAQQPLIWGAAVSQGAH